MASQLEYLTAVGKERNPAQETEYQRLLKDQGTGGGLIPDLPGIAATQKANTTALLGNQATQQEDYLSRFRAAIGGQETLPAMYSRLGSELGLPELQKRQQMLTEAVRATPQLQTQSARGMDVNENQRQRIIAAKLAELSPAAQLATEQAQTATGQLQTAMGFEQSQQQKELAPFQTEQTLLQDRQAREIAAYSEADQRELDGYIAKMNAGITLSEGEKNRANQLAIAEKGFEIQKMQIAASAAKTTTPSIKTFSQGGKTYLYNEATGQIVGTYGSGSAAAVGSWG